MTAVTTRQSRDPAAGKTSLRQDLGLGWRYLRSDVALWVPIAASIFTAYLNVTWTGLTAAIADRQFGHPARDSGLLVTSYGIGSVLTSVVSARVFPSARRSTLFTWAGIAAVTGLTLTASTRMFVVGLAGLFCIGIGHMLTSLSLNTAVQMHAHDSLRGRVTAIYLQAALLGNAFGSIGNAKMADSLGVRTAMLIDAALLAIVLIAVLRVRRALDHEGPVDPTRVLATAPA